MDTTQKVNRVNVYDYISGSLSYYPNSRTTMSLFLYESFYYWNEKLIDAENTKETGLTSRIGINIDYYISPRIRLDVYSTIEHYFTKSVEVNKILTKEFKFAFGASLVYKLF